ncbi:Hypothetical predicted protein [Xyrichtys novacula]|uniref:Uncharacterized protein n=1 Tax=Xyrichtys novacula TaxID=13765 RepID=A0AAV1EY34_XYRNO|nr:Hypothetical predicted protein [Xyrichtys novacula]
MCAERLATTSSPHRLFEIDTMSAKHVEDVQTPVKNPAGQSFFKRVKKAFKKTFCRYTSSSSSAGSSEEKELRRSSFEPSACSTPSLNVVDEHAQLEDQLPAEIPPEEKKKASTKPDQCLEEAKAEGQKIPQLVQPQTGTDEVTQSEEVKFSSPTILRIQVSPYKAEGKFQRTCIGKKNVDAQKEVNPAPVKNKSPWKLFYKGDQKTCIGEKKKIVPQSKGEASTKPDQRCAHVGKLKGGISANDQAGRVTQMLKGPSQATKTAKTHVVVNRSVEALQTSEDVNAQKKVNPAPVKQKSPWKLFYKGYQKTCIGEKKKIVPQSEGEALTKPDQGYAHAGKPKGGISANDQAGRVTQMLKGPSQATKTAKTHVVVNRSVEALQTSEDVNAQKKVNPAPVKQVFCKRHGLSIDFRKLRNN